MADNNPDSTPVENIESVVVSDVEKSDAENDETAIEVLEHQAVKNIEIMEESICTSSEILTERCVPGPLPKDPQPLKDIKDSLLALISKSEAEEDMEAVISYLKPRKNIATEVQKIALVSHTISAYISSLEKKLVCRVALQLVSDTSLWISKIFRFFDSLAYFNKDSREGLVRVIRMVLHMRYMRYSSTGYEALFTRPPVIYYCDPLAQTVGKYLSYLCSQLGLPFSCITAVPSLTGSLEGQFKMDPSALEKCIKDDLSATKTPLLVIANAGASVMGQVDNLQKIQEICGANNVWLHLNGHSLSALSLVMVPNLPSNIGDSMTLSLGEWIGLPSLPYITLYKAKEMTHVHSAGLGQASYGNLDFLPVWFAVQTLGSNALIQMIRYSFEVSDCLLEGLENFPELRIISKKKPIPKDGNEYDVATIGEKSIPTMVLLDALTPVLVFQYTPIAFRVEGKSCEKNPPYFDNLNSWLVQLMARQIPSIRTEILELEEFGICLRICALENTHLLGTTKKDIEHYFLCLQQQIEILNSTVLQKEKLQEDQSKYPKLQLVDIANWAGMGGVRYIPDVWLDRINELTDTGKADINHLNSELVTKLKASDSAFSLGEADDGMLCVRFGMVDANLNLDELMNMVTSAGGELEESTKFLETMSEMIKNGIVEANKELQLENQEKIIQEGVLRQVPVLGSLVSWWYPSTKEGGIKGRSFNLSSGTIESTENIYKYHMQVKESTKSPPSSAKTSSRTSSQSSTVDVNHSPAQESS